MRLSLAILLSSILVLPVQASDAVFRLQLTSPLIITPQSESPDLGGNNDDENDDTPPSTALEDAQSFHDHLPLWRATIKTAADEQPEWAHVNTYAGTAPSSSLGVLSSQSNFRDNYLPIPGLVVSGTTVQSTVYPDQSVFLSANIDMIRVDLPWLPLEDCVALASLPMPANTFRRTVGQFHTGTHFTGNISDEQAATACEANGGYMIWWMSR